MKVLAAVEWVMLCLVPWLPFAVCAYLAAREWANGGQHWAPPAWLRVFLALPPCLGLGLHLLLADRPVTLAAVSVLLLFSVPLLARWTGMPAGYAAYCLLPGIFASMWLTALQLDGWPPWLFQLHGVAVAVLLVGSGLCSWACRRCLERWAFPYRDQIAAVKGVLFDVPGLIYLGLLLFFHYGDVAFGGSGYTEMVELICCSCCFVGLWDAYRRNNRLLKMTVESVNQRNRAEFLAHSLQLQQDRYSALVEQAQVARTLRHDLRHHEMLINQYLCSGDREGLAAYAQEFRRQQERLRLEPSVCNHPVVDALARHYLGQMEKVGTSLDVLLQIDEQCPIPGADLCVVVGNCLENALEAVQQADPSRRYFRMRALQDGPMLTIVAENGYSGDRRREGTGFLSTKRPGRGVGLASMASMAEKYHGDFRAQAEDGAFRVSVALFGEEGS